MQCVLAFFVLYDWQAWLHSFRHGDSCPAYCACFLLCGGGGETGWLPWRHRKNLCFAALCFVPLVHFYLHLPSPLSPTCLRRCVPSCRPPCLPVSRSSLLAFIFPFACATYPASPLCIATCLPILLLLPAGCILPSLLSLGLVHARRL